MNDKLMAAVAAFLILGMLLGVMPRSYAQTYAIGPKLDVTTIPQDDQVLGTGVMILGINPALGHAGTKTLQQKDLMSQHKITVTYNGAILQWHLGDPGPSVTCNVLEKDEVNVIDDPKNGTGKQGSWENLMTRLVDVSNKFLCKVRWMSVAAGVLESVGVVDVYFTGTPNAVWIADNILVVEALFTADRTVVFGSDVQDICVLGWAPGATVDSVSTANWIITKPDGSNHYVWQNAMGSFVSCESLAIAERAVIGIPLATGPDPLSKS
jgi:hypothetical protein